jgi:hypothetical protein
MNLVGEIPKLEDSLQFQKEEKREINQFLSVEINQFLAVGK